MSKGTNPHHEDSGYRCLVAHTDGDGQCIQCKKCGKWIRPIDWKSDPCTALIAQAEGTEKEGK